MHFDSATPFNHYPVDALMHVAQRPPHVFVRGQGSWLWDSTGRRYLDFVQGWAVNALGHAAPEVVEALARQAGRLLHSGPGLYNDRAIELAAELGRLSGLTRVFFTNNGAEANEGAIKLARKFGQVHRGGAHRVITFENAFHGRTLATMSASGKPGFDRLFPPKVPGFAKARLNELASVEALVDRDTVAVLLELVQGEAGVIEAQPDFVRGLRRLCDEHGLLLMIDEVQTGIGRTGRLFGFEHHPGLKPDVVTLGKGLGGGVPIGAVLAREEVCCFAPGDQGGTFNGNALVCAAAQAVVARVSQPDFLAGVRDRAEQLKAGLQGLARRRGLGAWRGAGLLQALELPPGLLAGPIAETALGLATDVETPGLLVNPVRPERLRFIPALNCSAAEIELAVELLRQALDRVEATRVLPASTAA
ncbi:aminotransferase class III-fold pyridoxal phosphate-dependent enzyme [Aquabacterium sp. A7-Y]|uniref:aminotransferase class III-fold pyridoxal phosphate-dependent enzyme n=1 Tax=Aquabacterium sp. A7-Y TaxID=1349605 RepID=UPI00223CCF8A|nr:aminotransferase class III-fold pyridoxal phosphate-dependent enzyme [Aquabacterium sp. A7-Y]MCW7536339.1 aminotransferase class III-fold pyridoxal phosphate-dependent enzyme [Aquabacterium sp. A7-Y]